MKLVEQVARLVCSSLFLLFFFSPSRNARNTRVPVYLHVKYGVLAIFPVRYFVFHFGLFRRTNRHDFVSLLRNKHVWITFGASRHPLCVVFSRIKRLSWLFENCHRGPRFVKTHKFLISVGHRGGEKKKKKRNRRNSSLCCDGRAGYQRKKSAITRRKKAEFLACA